MAATATTPATTVAFQEEQERLANFISANFHRRLNHHDARDAAADALVELHRARVRGVEIGNPDAWARRAAWRNALDQIRSMQGEGRTPRESPADIDDFAAVLPEPEGEDLSDAAGRAVDVRALGRAWTRLKPDEQRAIHLRYYDELPVEEVLEILGCSRHHYENLTKRGLRRLREALVQTVSDDGCRACRALTLQAQDQPLLPKAMLEREAHLAGCLPCRAFARRQAGLIAALPLPAVGLADRISAYLGARFGSAPDVTQHAEAAAGATVATGASATAVGGGTAATGLLGGAGTAKVVAVMCGASAVTAAVCVPPPPESARDRPRPAQIAKAKPKRPTAEPVKLKTAPAVAAAAAVDAPPRRSTSARSRDDKPAVDGRQSTKPENSDPPADASPFLPESAATPDASSPDTTPTASTASTAAADTPPAQRSAPATPPPSADFSQEFTP